MFILMLLTILALVLVVAVGAGFVAFIASLPAPLLERAQEHGRFARLGTETGVGAGRPAAATPSQPLIVAIPHTA